MATDIQTTNRTAAQLFEPPRPLLPQAEQAMLFHLNRVSEGANGFQIDAADAPSDSLRRTLTAFVVSCDEKSEPATEPQIRAVVARLVTVLHSQKGEERAEVVIDQCAKSLVGYPFWAVVAAAVEWRAENRFWPVPADLVRIAQRAFGKIIKERNQAERLLSARIKRFDPFDVKEKALKAMMERFANLGADPLPEPENHDIKAKSEISR